LATLFSSDAGVDESGVVFPSAGCADGTVAGDCVALELCVGVAAGCAGAGLWVGVEVDGALEFGVEVEAGCAAPGLCGRVEEGWVAPGLSV